MRQKTLLGFASIALVCVALGLSIEPMEVDATQYASIAMEMEQSGQYLQVQHRGTDYLDKPPLLFWSSALSFKIFGHGNIAYKLFSFLALLLGALSVFKFSQLFYNRKVGITACIMYISNVAVMLIANDVRTDTLLIGWCAFTVWMAGAYLKLRANKYIIGVGIGLGLALLSKGPIGLMLPASAVGVHLLYHKKWMDILNWRWLISIFIAALLIIPMLYGLYLQFDLHPEKLVNGKTGVSGLYFYGWEQSFGRITGENVWKNNLGYDFFFHTFLWAFFPWIIAFISAIFVAIRSYFKTKSNFLREQVTSGAIIVPFLILSLSSYKLPHYIYIVVPFAAIFTAAFIESISNSAWKKGYRYLWTVQWILLFLSIILSFVLSIWAFPTRNVMYWILILGLAVFPIINSKLNLRDSTSWLMIGISSFCIFALTMNANVYPRLLQYQASSETGKLVKKSNIDLDQVYAFPDHGHALDLQLQQIIPNIEDIASLEKIIEKNDVIFLYVVDQHLSLLKDYKIPFEIVFEKPQFHITTLSLKFLNPLKRNQTLTNAYLLKIEGTD